MGRLVKFTFLMVFIFLAVGCSRPKDGEDGPSGSKGAPGVGNWKGAWSAVTNYSANDIVEVNGSSYFATASNLNDTPPSGNWDLLVEKGDAGSAGAQGPQGTQGVQGVQGNAGSNGSNGSNGSDGKTILNGSGAPAGGLGVDGDFYLDTSADEIYGPKTAGAWGSGVSLVGPQGSQGIQGVQGIQGPQGAAAETGIALFESDGDYYGRFQFYHTIYSTELSYTDQFIIMLSDSSFYISTGITSPSYYGYISANTKAIELYFVNPTDPYGTNLCQYPNATCSGSCGFKNPPIKNSILYDYDAIGTINYYLATGSETFIVFDAYNDSSYRDFGGTCQVISSNRFSSQMMNLYQVTAPYTLPTGTNQIGGSMTLGLK